jgi:hypothetical protein
VFLVAGVVLSIFIPLQVLTSDVSVLVDLNLELINEGLNLVL